MSVAIAQYGQSVISSRTAKSRSKVSPMLRKLASSEKSSLDLDRPIEEQDGLAIYDGSGAGIVSRAVYDVQVAGRRMNHCRSTSGTSQFSTTTSGSGQRTGAFVHPFQQTPRPYTPPIAGGSYHNAYQNSLRGGDGSESPVLTEDDENRSLRYPMTTSTAAHPDPYPYRSASALSSRNDSRTTSLISAPTSPPLSTQAPLRVQTTQLSPSASRLYIASSNSELHKSHRNNIDNNSLTAIPYDRDNISPLSTTPQLSSSSGLPSLSPCPILDSETGLSAQNMSPISSAIFRKSGDKGLSLCSRSDIPPPLTEREAIREARRKFEERERMKEEKAEREEAKALEKKHQKELRMKKSRQFSATATNKNERSDSDFTNEKVTSEGLGHGGAKRFIGLDEYGQYIDTREDEDRLHYGAMAKSTSFSQNGLEYPFGFGQNEGLAQSTPRRSTTHSVVRDTKRKIHSAWTRFMMWLRTRLMRMGSS